MVLREKTTPRKKSQVERYTSSLSLITYTFPFAGFSILAAIVLSALAVAPPALTYVAVIGGFVGITAITWAEYVLEKVVDDKNFELKVKGLIGEQDKAYTRAMRSLHWTSLVTFAALTVFATVFIVLFR